MNTIEETTDAIWQSMQRGEPAAAALRKILTVGDAYRVQVNLLRRWQSEGKKLAGWKIGMSGVQSMMSSVLLRPVMRTAWRSASTSGR